MSARTNYQLQQTVEPEAPSCRDNLRAPVRGNCDLSDSRAKNPSLWVWEAEHVGWCRRMAAVVILTLAAVLQGVLATLCQGRRKDEWGELGRAGKTGNAPHLLTAPSTFSE
jgi:hypothetical protein